MSVYGSAPRVINSHIRTPNDHWTTQPCSKAKRSCWTKNACKHIKHKNENLSMWYDYHKVYMLTTHYTHRKTDYIVTFEQSSMVDIGICLGLITSEELILLKLMTLSLSHQHHRPLALHFSCIVYLFIFAYVVRITANVSCDYIDCRENVWQVSFTLYWPTE